MGIYPPPLEKLISHLCKLPGIGRKSATRMALHILRSDREQAQALAQALLEVKEKIRFCSVCFNFTDDDPCPICADPSRADGRLCVVEGPGDQLVIEVSGVFSGRYHVLQGILSPLDGIGPEDLKISELILRLQKEDIKEVILATNPTTQGEATASFLARLIKEKSPGIKVTRIALGVPVGGDLKYMDKMTLQRAVNSRISIE